MCISFVTRQIPRVDEPKVLWEKIQSVMEQYRKPPPTGDK